MSLYHSGYPAMRVELPRRKSDKEMRKSIPRHIDKKFRIPEEEKGAWGSQGGDAGLEFSRRSKGQMFLFSSTFLRII